MIASLPKLEKSLHDFNFTALFIEELGWDRHAQELRVDVDGQNFLLRAVAEKRGMVALVCSPVGSAPGVPEYGIRRKIEKHVSKRVFEHLIIYVDAAKTTQVWQWVKREPGKPVACREHVYRNSQKGTLLAQKLARLAVALDEEERLTLVDVASRARAAFDIDRVTKRFYDQFKKEHAAFLGCVNGIVNAADQEWYTSVMLNRLMFVYFVQKRGFLDNDQDYLRTRLKMVQQRRGPDRFHSFYRYFLLRLFHDGLGKRERDPELTKLIGRVPYLNGGLFLPHPIEERYDGIQIPDEAFERVFTFFDGYQWHLDERLDRAGNEINPDVIGYIFEKYINQKELGAYYTKDDITDYIARSTIVPYLLAAAEKECQVAFRQDGSLWGLLRQDPDAYIYADQRLGVGQPLPSDVNRGLGKPAARNRWNVEAGDAAVALPTETWRDVVGRRSRYEATKAQLAGGAVTTPDDLVRFNLDLAQFIQDAIAGTEGPEVLRAFYLALEQLSVLDPTCGSGAFLFAALKVLEPIYEACLDRMQVFVDEAEGGSRIHKPEHLQDFRAILANVAKHPNRSYFILKSIVVNNLYGVDLVEEAVEICKLRLFLKLIAQAEDVDHIEPLPDIDFNIRAGNTLVGFSSREEMEAVLSGDLVRLISLPALLKRAEDADRAFQRYRAMQTDLGTDGKTLAKAKGDLRRQLQSLNSELDAFLAGDYGVNPNRKGALEKWRVSHQPFHWFVEFYGIMQAGGFDVIIGNPPYIELSALEGYRPKGFATEAAGNLYALVMERSDRIAKPESRLGFIVPVSSVSTERYRPLQQLLTKRDLFYSSYDDRPSRLFDGLEHIRLTIHIMGPERPEMRLHSTNYQKWFAPARSTLFSTLSYAPATPALVPDTLPKLCSDLEESIIRKLCAEGAKLSSFYAPRGKHQVFYSRKVGYFLQVLDFEPEVRDGAGKRRPPSEFKTLTFDTAAHSGAALACLNSSLFYWFVTVFSDCRHLNKREIDAFPLNLKRAVATGTAGELASAGKALTSNLKRTSEKRTMRFKHDTLTVQCIIPRHSKALIDDVDAVLAKHYGFTTEELDFIVNYDVKFRLGLTGANEDEE